MANKKAARPVEDEEVGPPTTPQGFWLSLRLPPGMPHRSEVQLERDLEDHLRDLGLRVGGGSQKHLFIEAEDRELALADQIDLADWFLSSTRATHVAVTNLTRARTMPPATSKVLRIDRFDLASLAVGWLYRMGRIRAEQYAEILGGFLPDPNGELFA